MDCMEQFFALVQNGMVKEYREKFEMLAGRVFSLTDDMLKSNFMNGLKPEIRAALQARGIVDTMRLAQTVEDEKQVKCSG